MIKKFSIEGFKTFKERIEFSLEPMTVIIGNNNAGKSTLLHALTFFQHCIDATWCSTDKTLKEGSIIGLEIQGVLPVAKLKELWPDADTSNPIYLRGDFGSASIELNVSLGANASRFKIEPNICGTLPEDFEHQNIRFIPVFSSFSPREKPLSPVKIKDHLRNNRYGQVVRNLLVELHGDKCRWGLLDKVISEMFSGTKLSICKTSPNIEVVHSQNGRTLDLLTAGAGFHQGLQIFASTIAGGPGTVLLDEPDAHLHAQRQERLMEVLRGLTDKTELGLQFVLASHSPHIVHSAPRESLRLLDDGKVIGFDSDTRTLFDEIGVTDRMLYVPLMKKRVILFVENRSDETFLKCFAGKYWGKDEALRIWEEITVLHTSGAPQEKGVIKTAEHVGTVLNSIRQGKVTVIAVSDRDYRLDEECERAIEEVSSSATNYTLTLYMWKAKEQENYLLDVDAISRFLETTNEGKWSQELHEEFSKRFAELVEKEKDVFLEKVFTQASEFANREAGKAKKGGSDEFLKHKAVQDALSNMQRKWEESPQMFCRPKEVLRGVDGWYKDKRDEMGLNHQELHKDPAEKIIPNMCNVPEDVRDLLDKLKCATGIV